MASPSISTKATWTDAVKYFQSGQRKRAHALYDMLWKVRPPAFEQWFNAGYFSREDKMPDRAIRFLLEAQKRQPGHSRVQFNLALAYSDLKKWPEVVAALEGFKFDAAIANEAINLLGVGLRHVDRRPEALEVLERLLIEVPDYQPAFSNRVNILADLERYKEAITWLYREMVLVGETTSSHLRIADFLFRDRRAKESLEKYILTLAELPDAYEHYLTAGKKFYSAQHWEDAVKLWQTGMELEPAGLSALANIGATLRTMKEFDRAAVYLRRALAVEPGNTAAANGLGNLYLDRQNYKEAEHWFLKALETDDSFMLAKANLVRTYSESQQWDKAAAMAREVIDVEEMDPDQFVAVFSTLKKVCDFEILGKHDFWAVVKETAEQRGRFGSMLDSLSMADTAESIASLFEVHKIWAKRVKTAADQDALPPLVAPPRRAKLRVGLLSGDLRGHVVGMFMRPVIKNYNRDKFELVGLSTYPADPDVHQKTIISQLDKFVKIGEKKPKECAALIREQEIDVMVELNGFTKYGNLGSVAWRPATVAIEYLGYPFTTGLEDMDYVFVDRFCKPGSGAHLVERMIESEGPYYCLGNRDTHGGHGFGDDIVDPNPYLIVNKYVTFGTFNNPYKITTKVVDAWAQIMHGVPDSRLSIVRYETSNETLKKNIRGAFEERGIDPERIILDVNPRGWHMLWYNRVDIALDTFPQTGGTTTCETTWMGVPVVSLVGSEIFGRLSYSILMQAGYPELCCQTVEDYIQTAIQLGLDTDRIIRYRRTMRDQVRASPLCDEVGFARTWMDTMERAYDQR